MNLTLEEQLKILQNTNRYLTMQVSKLSLDNAMLNAQLDHTMEMVNSNSQKEEQG